MKVAEIMTSPVVCIRPTEPVAHAKNLMLKHKIKHLVVLSEGQPIGIVSMKDMAEALSMESSPWRRRPIDDIPTEQIMHGKLITAAPGTDVAKAADMMIKHGISSLVITEGRELAGILTKTDLTRFFSERLEGRAKVRDLMSTKVITANRGHSLSHLVDLMGQNNIGRVVIVSGERPIGIVTTADMAFAQLELPSTGVAQRKVSFTRKQERAGRPKYRYVKYVALLTAEDVMRAEPLTAPADEDAARAARLMLEHNISGLPVVEEEKLVGILTKTDLTKSVAKLGE